MTDARNWRVLHCFGRHADATSIRFARSAMLVKRRSQLDYWWKLIESESDRVVGMKRLHIKKTNKVGVSWVRKPFPAPLGSRLDLRSSLILKMVAVCDAAPCCQNQPPVSNSVDDVVLGIGWEFLQRWAGCKDSCRRSETASIDAQAERVSCSW